jgi:hypothetical protein
VIVSLDLPSCEVPYFDPELGGFIRTLPDRPQGYTILSAIESLPPSEKGSAHLSRCNSGWFCHRPAGAAWELLEAGGGTGRAAAAVSGGGLRWQR